MSSLGYFAYCRNEAITSSEVTVTFPTTAGQKQMSHPFLCSVATSGNTTREVNLCLSWTFHWSVHTSSKAFNSAGERWFSCFLKNTTEKFAASFSWATKATDLQQLPPTTSTPYETFYIQKSLQDHLQSFRYPPKLEHHHRSLLKDLQHGDTWKSDKFIVFYTHKSYSKTSHHKQHNTSNRGLSHISLQNHLMIHLFHVFKRWNPTVKCNMQECFF